MEDNYWESLNQNTEIDEDKIETLPITHNTCYKSFVNMIKDKGVVPQKKDKMVNKDVLFFYYGIPLYVPVSTIYPCIFVFEVDDDFYDEINWTPIDSGSFKILKNSSVYNGFDGMENKTFRDKFILESKNNSLTYLKKHSTFFFGSNANYINGKLSNAEIKKDNPSISMRTVHDLFKTLSVQKHLVEELFEKSGLIFIDKRARIVEGHSKMSVRFRNISLIFCHIPDFAVEEIEEKFEIDRKSISTFEPNIQGKNEITISKGFDAFKEFISTKYPKIKFEK